MIDQDAAPTATRARPAIDSKVDRLRPTYGFDDVSLAPGVETIEPNDVELGQSFCGIDLAIPILAAAMDAVVDPAFAGALARLGGLAVLN
ncbi:MAG: IMP dehydrogenase, partial [Chloroflexi bacterium]|nr:IMP dehydrogenase [Chloroflexota bacterium]